MAPVLNPLIDNMGFPVPFVSHPCYGRNWAGHHLCSCPINQSTQNLEAFFNYTGGLLVKLITANLDNQQ